MEELPPINHTTTLSGRDAIRFLQIIESEAEPNQKLTEAAKRYKDNIENGKIFCSSNACSSENK